jgi:hypothetical protein
MPTDIHQLPAYLCCALAHFLPIWQLPLEPLSIAQFHPHRRTYYARNPALADDYTVEGDGFDEF